MKFVGQNLTVYFCMFLLLSSSAVKPVNERSEGESSATVTPISIASIEWDEDAVWQVPTCSKRSTWSKGKRIKTTTFEFVVPAGLLVKKVADADYLEYVVFSGKAKGQSPAAHLEIWFGANVAGAGPPQDIVQSSVKPRKRSWSCNKISGLDARGELTDGTSWRWIRLPLGVASYRTKSRDLAEAFDDVIDSFCCRLDLLST